MANGEQQWATGVLRGLGKQPTARNVSNLIGWAKAEGGHTHNDARYNYLNTTQNMPGAGNTGTQGNIKVYKSLQQGIQATVKTLKNGRYGSILHALDGSPQQLASAIDSSPWGTHNPNLASIISTGSGRPAYGGSTTQSRTSAPAPDTPTAAVPVDDGARRQALLAYASDRGNPNALLGLATALQSTGQAQPAYSDPTANNTAQGGTLRRSTGGAGAAVSWIQSKVGDPDSQETGGANQGGLASYANKQFGFNGAPWCAMFTSLAVTKGGAPSSARTASVAVIRQQAQQGGKGYEKGFVKRPQAGDLILWGNDHVAMVEEVHGNKVTYVGGNQSNNVTRRTTSIGDGDYVRPRYAR